MLAIIMPTGSSAVPEDWIAETKSRAEPEAMVTWLMVRRAKTPRSCTPSPN